MKSVAKYSLATFYNHDQINPATTWVVDHNLGKTPIVEVLINNPENGVLEKAIPEQIQVITEKRLHVVFSSALTGKVRVVA